MESGNRRIANVAWSTTSSRPGKDGAEEEETMEAIPVGKIVRKGAAGKMDQHASTMFKDTATAPNAAEEGGGCRLT